MPKDPQYKQGYIVGYWDGVQDAVSGKITEWQVSDIGNLPIKAMALSTRAYDCLEKCGCTHVKDVIALNSDAIMRMHGLGPKTASEIANWLIEHGLLGSAWSEYI